MTAETEGDKWRKWIYDVLKLALPALLTWYGTSYVKQQEIDHKDGALDTCNGVVYTNQSPSYYEGFHEQIEKEVAEREEAASAEEVETP